MEVHVCDWTEVPTHKVSKSAKIKSQYNQVPHPTHNPSIAAHRSQFIYPFLHRLFLDHDIIFYFRQH